MRIKLRLRGTTLRPLGLGTTLAVAPPGCDGHFSSSPFMIRVPAKGRPALLARFLRTRSQAAREPATCAKSNQWSARK
jgi:hypothetical protein